MLLIDNARILTPQGLIEGSVLCKDGEIAKIGHFTPPAVDDSINAHGCIVLPGVIDSHVHFREPGEDHKETWETASKAAAKGGVTTVLDMPNNNPPTTTVQRLAAKRALVKGRSFVNYGFHFGATPTNADEILEADNIASVKVYMGATTGDLLVEDDGALYGVFKACKQAGHLAMVHAENNALVRRFASDARKAGHSQPSVHGRIRDNVVAAEASSRAAILSKSVGNRLHLAHISTRQELNVVRLSQGRVTCEATPHHLLLEEDAMESLGNYAKVNPPLREDVDRRALWRQFASIDCISSDHAPHTKEEKQRGYWEAPAGVPGVETLLPLMLNEVNRGRIELADVVEKLSAAPARIFGLETKGRIAEGMDADLTIVDMGLMKAVDDSSIVSKCGWSPFAGTMVRGWPVTTIVNGGIAYNKANFFEPVGREVRFAHSKQ
jgi:dihydroorotase